MKINAKTFAGVGLGLVAGYFLFKSKNKKFLYIGGMGLAGGVLANLILNREAKKPITVSTDDYIQNAQDEILDNEMDNIEVQEVSRISTELKGTSTKDNFDIDLGFPK